MVDFIKNALADYVSANGGNKLPSITQKVISDADRQCNLFKNRQMTFDIWECYKDFVSSNKAAGLQFADAAEHNLAAQNYIKDFFATRGVNLSDKTLSRFTKEVFENDYERFLNIYISDAKKCTTALLKAEDVTSSFESLNASIYKGTENYMGKIETAEQIKSAAFGKNIGNKLATAGMVVAGVAVAGLLTWGVIKLCRNLFGNKDAEKETEAPKVEQNDQPINENKDKNINQAVQEPEIITANSDVVTTNQTSGTYIVKEGDNPWTLSKRWIEEYYAENNINRPVTEKAIAAVIKALKSDYKLKCADENCDILIIKPGMELVKPDLASLTKPDYTIGETYVVRDGDSAWKIAKEWLREYNTDQFKENKIPVNNESVNKLIEYIKNEYKLNCQNEDCNNIIMYPGMKFTKPDLVQIFQ